MRVRVEIAPGELLDKLSILEIKSENISDAEKLAHIQAEYETLMQSRNEHIPANPVLDGFFDELKRVNKVLWDIEDEIRVLERNKNFGDEFIKLARAVYQTNDQRAEIKNKINRELNSDIAEAKSYEDY